MSERVIGRIPVLECLRAGKRKAKRLYIARDAKGIENIRAAAGDVPVSVCSRDEIAALAPGTVHQGVVLEAEPLPLCDMDDWATRPFPESSVIVALDEIADPHNFGAIVRSAAACGACGVVFCARRAAPVSPASVKSAAGAMEYIDLVRCANLARGLATLKNAGFWTMALDADAPQTIWDIDLTGRIVLVVGSEGRGVRKLVRETCDFAARIPLTGPITSLNASVSLAAALIECMRQRAARSR